jgi:hypothetical protein
MAELARKNREVDIAGGEGVRGHSGLEGILESVKWPMSTGLEGWGPIDRTIELHASARANQIPVIFATGMGADFPSPWAGRSGGGSRLTPEQEEIAYKIVDEIASIPGELVIKKASASAF